MKALLLFVLILLSGVCAAEQSAITIEYVGDDLIGYSLARDKSAPIQTDEIPAYIAKLKQPNPPTQVQVALIKAGVRAVPLLCREIHDANLESRNNIIEVLGRIGPAAEAAIPDLMSRLTDQNNEARWNVQKALGRIGAPAIPFILERLKSSPIRPIGDDEPGKVSKDTLIEILEEMRGVAAGTVGHLLEMLEAAGEMKDGDDNHNLRQNIKNALRSIGKDAPQIAGLLRYKLKAPLFSVRYAAALTLIHMRVNVDDAMPVLFETLRNRAIRYVGWGDILKVLELSDKPLSQLSAGLEDQDDWIRRTTLQVYFRGAERRTGTEYIPKFITMLNDPNTSVQYEAICVLGRYGELAKDGVEPLRKKLKANIESFLRIGIIQAFANLGKHAPGVEDDIVAVLKASHFQPTKVPTGVPVNQLKIPDQSGFDDTESVRKACVATLLALKPAGPEKLKELLHDPDANVRRLGAWSIGQAERHGRFALTDLTALAGDADPAVRAEALKSILILDPELHQKLAAKALEAPAPAVKPPAPPKADDF